MKIIEFKNITMRFGNIIANDNISFAIEEGKIHSLIGENGAGKSTLMSVLFGMYKPTNGTIKIRGENVNITSPRSATRLGLGMVHQHFKLVGIYNAVENIMIGRETTKNGILDVKAAKEKIGDLASKYNFDLDLNIPVKKMTVGQQQKIEILKMLYADAEILIFDEPTAVLSPKEIDGFLKLLKDFRDNGKTIILITHKLEEIKEVADEATIIRLGKVIKTGINVKKTSIKKMSSLMVGKDLKSIKTNRKILSDKEILRLDNVTIKHVRKKAALDNVSFTINAGEIVAIAGVEGNGQSELAEVISGLAKPTSGRIFLNEVDINKLSIKNRGLQGISHVPEDRQKYGLILDMPLWENMTSNTFTRRPYSFYGILNNRNRKITATKIISSFDVRGAAGGYNMTRSLSGGNQQKAIVGREITNQHDLLVAVQPTRGLDLGAIEYIHKQILNGKKKGKATLLISYELHEVIALADKVVVMNGGKVIDTFSGNNISREKIGIAMATTNMGEQNV